VKAASSLQERLKFALNDGGIRRIVGERVFLDLGSHSAMPNVPRLTASNPMTHIEVLDLDRLPRHLIVIGGGYIGLELAQAVRRFGSNVTVIERGAQLADREDSDVGAALLDLFHDEGIEVLLGTQVSRVEGHSGQEVRVYGKDAHGERIVEGTDLLVSVGRTPNTKGIGLEQVGVELDGRGYIKVNDRLETTAPNVWAMGDCAGSPQFTHVAYHDFRVVRDNLQGGNRSTKDRIVPFCMFTDPELARVGRNEIEAKRDQIDYRVAKLPMANVLRTVTIAEPRGFMKMLIGRDSDEIVGFTAFGIEASELMAAVHTAMVGRLPYTALRDAIFAHPTMSEGLVFLLEQVDKTQVVIGPKSLAAAKNALVLRESSCASNTKGIGMAEVHQVPSSLFLLMPTSNVRRSRMSKADKPRSPRLVS
jgi:pyruvate/2-oxoglutarate dehydrogenase complex dihydrolipoamide dehydrogenase (E3) component